ncbi:MAG: tolB protein precursor [Solitalea-like symbiont of Tyrophagus putrescentiae]
MIKISKKAYLIFTLLSTLTLIFNKQSVAQYFGNNKIQYKKLQFEIFETPHFNIYNYFKNKEFINNIANISELYYKHHSTILERNLTNKNPIIIYANHSDFSQTTLSPENIDIGTGGVTEGFKNRIFMPVFESRQQNKHVIGHELVHGFQYDILKNTDDISLENIRNIPLWMTEGMAEYMSKGSVDAATALALRDSFINKKLPGIKDLNNLNKYFPYKYGQAFWAFITSNWSDKIIKTLFLNTAKYGYLKALEKTLSCSEEELSQMWKDQTAYIYEPLVNGTTEPIGKEFLGNKSREKLNLAPQLSPDGQFITFFSEKNAISIDLYIAETETGKIIKKISGHTEKLHIDEYNYIEDSGSWGPNSDNYVYTVVSKGRTALIIVDVATGKTIKEIFIKELPFFSHPAYSPDGNSILLTSLNDGQSNLFLYNIKEQTVKQLTFDESSKLQASWSRDGQYIIFTSDNSTYNDLSTKYKNYKTNILNIATNSIETIDILKGADNLNPLFSEDGTKIYFLSNLNGFRNLFEYDLTTKEIFQLTNYFTGISGITDLSSALSISHDKIIYIYFKDNQYKLYKATTKDFKKHRIENDIISNIQGAKLSINNINTITELSKEEVEKLQTEYINKTYKPSFSFTALSQSAGVGIVTNMATTGLGAAGNVDALFTDILDRHKLLLSIGLNGEIYDIGGGIFYLNQENRINWSAGLSHTPYLYTYGNIHLIETKNDNKIQYNYYKLRIFDQTIGGAFIFPLFRTLRFEAGSKASLQNYRVDRIRNIYKAVNINGSYYPGAYIGSQQDKLNETEVQEIFGVNTKSILSLSSYIAYVGDNAIFGLTAPVKGYRYRFEVGTTFGGIQSINLLTDIRKYLFKKPLTLAIKGIYIGRLGHTSFQTNVLSLGYDEFVRGYSNLYDNLTNTSIGGSGILAGSQLINSSIELRLPFTGPRQLAIIESKMFFTDLALFFDAGSIWGKPDTNFNNSLNGTAINDHDYRKARIIASTGIALRFNLFGIAVLEPYYAIPFSSFQKKGAFGLFISAGGW